MSSAQAPPTFKVGLTPDEKKLYTQLFKSLDPENTGIITGEKSRSTFESSGLPPAILGEIWQIADQDNLGFLNQFGFCYAMRLIGYTQAGHHPTPGLADVPGPLPKFANLTLQPQSTSSSFLSNLPSAGIQAPPPPPPSASAIAPLSAADYQKFSQLFIRTVGSAQGELGGEQAREILLKAKLPTPVLGQIWTLVDRFNTGKLNVGSFAIAMHLIQGLLSGSIRQLPPFLPDSVWQSVDQQADSTPQAQVQARQVSHSSINSQSTAIRHPPPSTRNVSTATVNNDWAVTPAMKQQYQSIFNNLDKEKTGSLNPDQVASFLMTSKLSQQDLATVWDLSDIQNSGIFTILEFSIALFLVNRKLAGGELPNIVPDALLSSLQEPSQPVGAPSAPVESALPSQSAPPPPPPPPPAAQPGLAVQSPQVPKSSMDDLVDIFGSTTSTPPVPSIVTPPQPTLQQRASSSDLSHSQELAKARPNFTGSFKPTSTFGQSLMSKHTGDENKGVDNLLQEEKPKELSPVPTPPVVQEQEQRTVNYDALRSVPPPPQKRATSVPATPPPPARTISINRTGSQQAGAGNDDLLADPAISGQLSQATSDIANFSNQIKSLAGQTSNLQEKKTRAEQELQRILGTKVDIENKLKQLRSSYDNEVKQVQQVESNLAAAKEETEALRSEASIAEAKLNSLSSELNEKQAAMDELQKENTSLKERLATYNAEISQLESQVATKSSENQSLSNKVAVKKSQVQVSIVKCEELRGHITEIEESYKQLQLELDNAERERLASEREQQELLERSTELEKSKPTTASPGISATVPVAAASAVAGAAVGVIAGELHHKDSSEPTESAEQVSDRSVAEDETSVQTETADEDISKRFPELSVSQPEDTHTNVTSSIATDNADETETPITSPSNSDFQFPQAGNAGIVGGMVGMPGVLVGVQRTDSLTSSVQNNAALSVRDDNIDEISDRETLEDIGNDEETVPNTANTDHFDNEARGEGSDKGSSGHESFEIVNSEEARDQSEEFPPIKELDYQESDSSEDEEEQKFDDAVDHLSSPAATHPVADAATIAAATAAAAAPGEALKAPDFGDFDSAFDNLQPATPEVNKGGIDDAFANEFDDLEAAKVDNEEVEDFAGDDFGGLSNEFTNSNAPDFTNGSTSVEDGKAEGNDEWEQLFAGFGNANVATNEVNPVSSGDVQPTISTDAVAKPSQENQYAIQELIGMGFDEKTATDALKKENWNLEAATNYLLDNA
ncbi:uncharacterized protein SPAPADRAFT_67033 [Spathaspora passalidarum NRRL Y-27907]|uniref:EH domain-containing and endocytosis protein 1 n=1 Tax=Spathaspora passalidarum (strain NRRL Y-27907 / 11-Y1) TaxID=619300 RepID=G3AN03_SPAPN|nr:uncharacterized protein SPAPADRAFT_67033 [Spathaspora passalidarum NRRL Y-27907]EGW32417.1 hypothetical protein SPAPADRAFT_67033 [Spathaspora passalidarum NRRL Y-27907]